MSFKNHLKNNKYVRILGIANIQYSTIISLSSVVIALIKLYELYVKYTKATKLIPLLIGIQQNILSSILKV